MVQAFLKHPNEPTYVSNQYRWQNQREDEDQTMRQSSVRSQYRWKNQREYEDQTRRRRNVRRQNRTILPTPSQDQQERYPRKNHPISRQQEDQGHYLNAQNHHPQRWHPDQQM